jgi:hypothetical protein
MSHCDPIQEKIAREDALSPVERAHVLDCPECTALAAEYSLLEGVLSSFALDVPSGFADRVMARVGSEPAALRLFERRWVALAIAYAGGAVALGNVARFLAGTLSASVGLGGTP